MKLNFCLKLLLEKKMSDADLGDFFASDRHIVCCHDQFLLKYSHSKVYTEHFLPYNQVHIMYYYLHPWYLPNDI